MARRSKKSRTRQTKKGTRSTLRGHPARVAQWRSQREKNISQRVASSKTTGRISHTKRRIRVPNLLRVFAAHWPLPKEILRLLRIYPRAFLIGAGLVILVVGLTLVLTAPAGLPESLPPGTAVSVGGSAIPVSEVTHWMQIVAHQIGGSSNLVPDAPNFTNCIADGRAKDRTQKKNKPLTNAQLKQQCQSAYTQILDQALSTVIGTEWLEQAAKAEGVSVSNKEVQSTFVAEKQKVFKTSKAFAVYLAQNGETEADLETRVRAQLLGQALQQKVYAGVHITEQQIRNYYQEHPVTPATYDLQLILTSTEAEAQAAKRAVENGESWANVAKRFSIDPSKAQGGSIKNFELGEADLSLQHLIESAPVGQIAGPVKSVFGWYVIRVQKIHRTTQPTLAQSTPSIRSTLLSQQQSSAWQTFFNKWQASYKAKTVCQSNYYYSQACGHKVS